MEREFKIYNILNKYIFKLEKDEKESQISQSTSLIRDSNFVPVGRINLNDFTAYWKLDSPVLLNISTLIEPGQLVAVMGPVSSGKTSFLSCFVKEIPFYTGEISYKGRIAYVEQEPYIFNMSLRDNVIFGSQFDEELYNNVLHVCNLTSDIEIMGGSDQFEIGEKGNNLSGGQRARLALARALYSQADIYLLDDPLSALDSNVNIQNI